MLWLVKTRRVKDRWVNSPQRYCACVEWDGQFGPPAAWPKLCTHSSLLLNPHPQPAQTDSEIIERKTSTTDLIFTTCWNGRTENTSINMSMLSMRACALPMMNWFTQAIAWDLQIHNTYVSKAGYNVIFFGLFYCLNYISKVYSTVSAVGLHQKRY